MGSYDEELKRYCMMKAIEQRKEEDMWMIEETEPLFSANSSEETVNTLPVLLAIGGILWVIDKIEKGVRAFLAVPWIHQYVRPYLTFGNFFVLAVVWLFIRHMRSGNK